MNDGLTVASLLTLLTTALAEDTLALDDVVYVECEDDYYTGPACVPAVGMAVGG